MGLQLAKLKKISRTPAAVFKNVDKVLDTKSVSPRHPTTVKAFDDLVEANPHFKTAVNERNVNLNKMLEEVCVNSTGVGPNEYLHRGKLTEKVQAKRHGKLSCKDIEDLFLNRKIDPETWNSAKISEHYNLDVNVAENLLKNYSSFRIFKKSMPESNQEKSSKNDSLRDSYQKIRRKVVNGLSLHMEK
ncbi:uncharacterized protein LOC105843790 isoform X2 [Hydra vulgaris]|uniref:uncharacterized protein LOC105843790 isoform X2 n=1 Tax=Hydra vulgaris TaxID=6087 RepID=UPI001F5ECA93|nr:uncharacterized protein LOC105843790 isoform X2 [Hydra vulgaris]